MSNEVNNLASSFVAMAQAFEQLPIVKAELESANTHIEEYAKQVQRLEMRLMDAKEELDLAHAATRKAEVERDHAETMFLETDSKLDSAKSVLNTLIGNAGAFLQAVEPPKPEPEPVVEPVPTFEHHEREIDQVAAMEAPQAVDPTIAPSWAMPTPSPYTAPDGSAVSDESVASSPQGESAPLPSVTTSMQEDATSPSPTAISSGVKNTASASTQSSEGVSVPLDPTPAMESSSENVSPDFPPRKPYEGQRYTDWPAYVSLVEWLNGGGTEELYYAK
jgi:hypothetical protein